MSSPAPGLRFCGTLADLLDRRWLGIGCNDGITRATGNILFDEKIAGTVHIAIGAGYPSVGGTNVSDLHWDLIKDLRGGGRIELDGEPVQQDGAWLI